MRKVMSITALAAVASLAVVGSAGAKLVQQSQIKIVPLSGAKPGNGKFVRLQSYLSTRDAASNRNSETGHPTKKANPVGLVFMDFPAGSTLNKAAKPTCNRSEYEPVESLAANCASSVVGTGWALLNTGDGSSALGQLDGSPPPCASNDATQYSRTWEANPAAGPDCTPVGDYYVKVTAYQGGVLKNPWWCYGNNTANYKYGANNANGNRSCDNKTGGGDAKNTLYATGNANNFAAGTTFKGSFNDGANSKGLNGCNIIFANDNSLAPVAFGGSATSCKNRLTVIIPNLNGDGAGLGELTGGIVLSDFYLDITATNYLKSGSKSCSSKKMTVKTQVVYSKLKGENTPPDPAVNNVTYVNAC